MKAFLAGKFVGADRSPLAYVGYHVGAKIGLTTWDRERRMLVCFRINIPGKLREYRTWGGPASRERLNAMHHHLLMLADMRRARPNYEMAVSEWQRDAYWLKAEVGDLAEKFAEHRVNF